MQYMCEVQGQLSEVSSLPNTSALGPDRTQTVSPSSRHLYLLSHLARSEWCLSWHLSWETRGINYQDHIICPIGIPGLDVVVHRRARPRLQQQTDLAFVLSHSTSQLWNLGCPLLPTKDLWRGPLAEYLAKNIQSIARQAQISIWGHW